MGLILVHNFLIVISKKKSMLVVFGQLTRDEKIVLMWICTHIKWNPVSHNTEYLRYLVFNKTGRFESDSCLLHLIPQTLFFLHFSNGLFYRINFIVIAVSPPVIVLHLKIALKILVINGLLLLVLYWIVLTFFKHIFFRFTFCLFFLLSFSFFP